MRFGTTESGDESSGVSRPGTGKNVDGGIETISGSVFIGSYVSESRKAAVLGVRASMAKKVGGRGYGSGGRTCAAAAEEGVEGGGGKVREGQEWRSHSLVGRE
jgi:hypothetical protein